MSSEDQFTSIQWDREEMDHTNNNPNDNSFLPIEEETEQQQSQPATVQTEALQERTSTDLSTSKGSIQSNHEAELDYGNDELQDDGPSNSLLISTENHRSVNPTSSATPPKSEDNYIAPTQSIRKTSVTENEPPVSQHVTPTSEEDDSLFDKYVIKTTVTNPTRDLDAASKPFISYLVTTTTDHPSILKLSVEKKQKEGEQYLSISVRRRYGDFRYLFESLSNDYPTVMIPPLPSKSNFKYLTGDTFGTEFVNKRLHSLDRFIRFILQHRALSQSAIFHLFISNSSDWATFTTSLRIKDINQEESGFVNKVVNEDLITEKVMNFLTPSKHKRETNKDILEINDKLKKLYENLIKLDRIFVKLNRKNHELSVDYEQFSNQIIKLTTVQQKSNINGETEQSNHSFKEETSMAENFKIFAESLNYFSTSWSKLYKYVDESFLVSLKDCSKYIVSLTNLIELQHNKKIDLQVLQEYLQKTRNEVSSLGGSSVGSSHSAPPNPVMNSYQGSGGIVNNTAQLIKDTLSTSATAHIGSNATDNKLQKLENKVIQLENEIAMQTKLVNSLTNKIITEEYPNWDRFNKNELKNSMIGLCDEQIDFYKGLIDKWGDAESKLLKRLDELN
ncbi:Sorting nexin-4 [Spathaspora sp. JA1]|nr:Sorting nexin-4 [Spathaspora sp. JA1]